MEIFDSRALSLIRNFRRCDRGQDRELDQEPLQPPHIRSRRSIP